MEKRELAPVMESTPSLRLTTLDPETGKESVVLIQGQWVGSAVLVKGEDGGPEVKLSLAPSPYALFPEEQGKVFVSMESCSECSVQPPSPAKPDPDASEPARLPYGKPVDSSEE